MSARNTIVFRFFKTYFTDKIQHDKLLASPLPPQHFEVHRSHERDELKVGGRLMYFVSYLTDI